MRRTASGRTAGSATPDSPPAPAKGEGGDARRAARTTPTTRRAGSSTPDSRAAWAKGVPRDALAAIPKAVVLARERAWLVIHPLATCSRMVANGAGAAER